MVVAITIIILYCLFSAIFTVGFLMQIMEPYKFWHWLLIISGSFLLGWLALPIFLGMLVAEKATIDTRDWDD